MSTACGMGPQAGDVLHTGRVKNEEGYAEKGFIVAWGRFQGSVPPLERQGIRVALAEAYNYWRRGDDMKKGLLAITMLMAVSFFFQACASTFTAYKDGHGYFVGNGSDSAYKLFCESGDLKKILTDTTKLGQDMTDNLYRYICGIERSREKVKLVYATMTPEQRKDLRLAFKHNGYEINYLHC
jgi:hypothetical protein